MKKKVFNYSELHFSKGTFYKIHTLRIMDYDRGRKMTFQASQNLADQIKALRSPQFAFEPITPTVKPMRRRGEN